jgi:hypothetical protein
MMPHFTLNDFKGVGVGAGARGRFLRKSKAPAAAEGKWPAPLVQASR